MSKERIDKLLKQADDALKSSGIVRGKLIIKEYEGYIAGFGATVVNIGIKSALAYYMKDVVKLNNSNENKPEPYRARVVRAIAKMLGQADENVLFKSVLDTDDDKVIDIYTHTQKIVDASIALKLMIRTYEFEQKNNEQI